MKFALKNYHEFHTDKTHEKRMKNAWNLHIKLILNAWKTHDKRMENAWKTHGKHLWFFPVQ